MKPTKIFAEKQDSTNKQTSRRRRQENMFRVYTTAVAMQRKLTRVVISVALHYAGENINSTTASTMGGRKFEHQQDSFF